MTPDPPFTTHGDEPIEARIVSWVLGEASDFEAAELQRLCEERPELLIFRQRIREIHGLLGDDEHPIPMEMWKLPPEKRRAIEELFGDEPVRLPVSRGTDRIRRRIGQVLLAAAACVALSLLVIRFYPFQEEGRVVIEVKPRIQGLSPFAPDAQASKDGTLPPQFFETESGKIRSSKTIKKVVERLGLAERWNVDEETAIQRVRDKVRTRQVKGTDLIEIRAKDGNELDAKRIAREVALAYRDYREELERKDAEKALAELNKAVRAQEDKVEDRRKVLTTIARAKKIIYKGDDAFYGSSGVDEEDAIKRGLDVQDYVDAKRDFDSDQELLQQLKLKLIGETVSSNMPRESVVIVEDSLDGMSSATPAALAAAKPRARPMAEEIASAPMSVTSARERQKRIPATPSRPAAPAASAPAVVASPATSLPEIATTDSSSLRFGDADDFGSGWGSQDEDAKQALAANGLRSGNVAIQRNNIDAILAKPQAGEGVVTRSSAALTYEQAGKVDEVRKNLYLAEGSYNLGKYDEARANYEQALRADPHNSAARRGIERIEAAKTDYYRAAYDHTRAELLAEVDKAWELAAPQDSAPAAGGDHLERSSAAAIPKEGEVDAARMLFDGVEAPFKVVPEPSVVAGYVQRLGKERADIDLYGDVAALDSAVAADSRRGGVEYEIDTGYASEYLFLGRELREAEPGAQRPVETAESLAVDDPYSTFSLNVSDASFQIARAAMAKGERPDPASIKPEQFYNAVDYQDAAPAVGEPVAVAIEQAAHPIVPGRNLVRIALKTASAGRAASQPLRLTLLVDHSGSMVREDRRAALKQALAGLSGLLTKNDRVTVIGFSRTPRLLADSLPGDKAKNLADLIHLESSEGGTNLEEALALGERLALRSKLDGAQNRIVLLTDGAANLGNAEPEELAGRIREMRDKGLAIDIAGMAADDLNDRLLAELARNGNGRYHVVGKGVDGADLAKQLAGAFRPAAENVKVQVRFNPERVGRYKLIGFEKDRLKTEDFRNDAVDAAEMAAEEAGVAVYQIEPLPGGTGEIGEVSVRFRDTAEGSMVERNWTIPHDANAPAFDRAAPSMQLAGLATLAAEKLRGGPAADAIDFRKLAEVRARVKQAYAGSPRVAELLEMIGSL